MLLPSPTQANHSRAAAAQAASRLQAAAPQQPVRVSINHYQTLHRDLTTGVLDAAGGVVVTYQPGGNGRVTTLRTDRLRYDPRSGAADLSGSVTIEQEQGTFVGDTAHYNFRSHTGQVQNAILETDYFRMTGKSMEEQPDGSLLVKDGSFTTCIHIHPDYHIQARSLLVKPGRYVSGKGISFYAGPTRLIWLPSYRYNLRRGGGPATPLPGYDKVDGLYLRMHDTPTADPLRLFTYDVRIGARRVPQGTIAYEQGIGALPRSPLALPSILPEMSYPVRGFLEQFAPPTYTEYSEELLSQQVVPRSLAFALLQNGQYVFNRLNTRLTVSRLPEVGVRFVNLLARPGKSGLQTPPAQQSQAVEGGVPAVLQRVPGAPLLLNLDLAGGWLQEDPTDTSAGRLAARVSMASQPLLIGRRMSVRAGFSYWLNLYSTGSVYTMASPEVEMDYVPTYTSRIGFGYRYVGAAGHSPFLFDRRDIRNEVRMQYQVGGPWAFGIAARMDVDRLHQVDMQFSVLRNFDCMQVGFAYFPRAEQFSILFNLLPPTANRLQNQRQPLRRGLAAAEIRSALLRTFRLPGDDTLPQEVYVK